MSKLTEKSKEIMGNMLQDAKIAALCDSDPGIYGIVAAASMEQARISLIAEARASAVGNIIPFPNMSGEIS